MTKIDDDELEMWLEALKVVQVYDQYFLAKDAMVFSFMWYCDLKYVIPATEYQ
jgi:hypothetical protein